MLINQKIYYAMVDYLKKCFVITHPEYEIVYLENESITGIHLERPNPYEAQGLYLHANSFNYTIKHCIKELDKFGYNNYHLSLINEKKKRRTREW